MLLSLKRLQFSLSTKISPYRFCRTLSTIPNEVDTLIVGGGIIGSSIALDLTQKTDNNYKILVLEQNTLTSGTTWHAAGLIGQIKHSEELTAMAKYSRDLYYNFENNMDGKYPIGWHQTGSIGILRGDEHFQQMLRIIPLLINANIEFQMYGNDDILNNNNYDISIKPLTEILNLHQFINIDDTMTGAIHISSDGIVNPSDATMAMVNLSKKLGNGNTTFVENCGVQDILMSQNNDNDISSAIGVKTTNGDIIKCSSLVLACGQWTRQIASKIDINIPVAIAPHQYAVFDKIEGVSNKLPVIRDFISKIYIKPEVGGFAVGTFESPHIGMPDEVSDRNQYNNIPSNVSNELYNENIDKINFDYALRIVPSLENVGLKYCIHGPDTHSIDNNPILGRAPFTGNIYVAAGFNSLGIQTGPGVGVVIADWILFNNPSYTFNTVAFSSCDILRFHPEYTQSNKLCEQRALECYSKEYGVHYPTEEWESFNDCSNDSAEPDCESIRLSSLHSTLKEDGALFSHLYSSGWKRALYFNKKDFVNNNNLHNILQYNDKLSYNHNKCEYLSHVRAEHLACRTGVVLFDLSSFAKYIINGKDSSSLLNYLSSSYIREEEGNDNKIIYTTFLNENGGIFSDFTIIQQSFNNFYCVTASNSLTKDIDHLKYYSFKLNLLNINITDITNQYSVLALMGPNSYKLLLNLCLNEDDLNNSNFPYGTQKYIDFKLINNQIINVCVLRVSFVGELGYEFHIASEYALLLYDSLYHYSNTADIGLINAGYHSFLNSLRLEKGYLHYGHDITQLDTQLEAGLGFLSSKKIKKGETNFLGCNKILKQKENGISKKLISFRVLNNNNVTLWGHEAIYRNNIYVGDITSGAIGFSTNNENPIGIGYVNNVDGGKVTKEYILNDDAKYEILIGGKKIPVEASWNTSLWDPKGKRMKYIDNIENPNLII